jgi:hypothetical protein
VDGEDLRLIDTHAFRVLRQLAEEDCDAAESALLVEQLAGRFEISLSDGTIVPLCRGGSERTLTQENRFEYSQLALKTRLHEGRAQMDAIRGGLSSLVPPAALQLLDWRELEALVTGLPEIDLDLLREHTVCRGGDQGEETIVERLWEVLPFDARVLISALTRTWQRERGGGRERGTESEREVCTCIGGGRA